MFAGRECKQWSPFLLDYAWERLTAPQKTAMERHLGQCARCRAEVAEYRQALNLATNALQQPQPASQATWAALRMQLQQGVVARPAANLPFVPVRWRWAGAGAALAGLTGLALWIPRVWTHPQADSSPALLGAITRNQIQPMANGQQAVSSQRRRIAQQHSMVQKYFVGVTSQRTNSFVPKRIVLNSIMRQTHPAQPHVASQTLIPSLAETRQNINRVQAASRSAVAAKPAAAPQSLPQDDLAYLNTLPAETLRRWSALPPAKSQAMEVEVTRLLVGARKGDDFVTVPLPQIAGRGGQATRAAAEVYAQEKAIVDTRLARKIRLGVKGMALSTLLKQISEETGLVLTANARVADDNVTIFCHARPVRDIMRQLSQHFGFQWLREGEEGAYKYELTQSVRSQLLEEEARNQDQDEALIALDKAMEKYRKFRGMNPTSLRAAETAMKGEDAQYVFALANGGWLPANLYFGLSPEDLQMLRSGQSLNFSMGDGGAGRTLPAELRPEVLNSFTDVRIDPNPMPGRGALNQREALPGSLPLSAAKNIAVTSELKLDRSQLGQFALKGDIFLTVTTEHSVEGIGHGITLAEVSSPAVSSPQNAAANARYAHDADLQKRVTIETPPSCELKYSELPDVEGMRQQAGKKCTTGDVLEAIFKATGKDVIGDFYTRLYVPNKVTESNATLFDALNRLGDTLHDRWTRDGDWLTFRSTSWFYDRPKEVPVRKLARWAASRREHGALTLDDLMEIGQLSNTQLDALTIFEGALARYDLQEWNFARSTNLRDHWRFLATVPAEMRLDLINGKELQANKLPLALQKKFIPLAVHDPDTDLRPGSKGMENPTLRIEYILGHIPPDRPNLKSLLLSNPIVFIYTYGDPSRDKYDRRASLIGPFNATIGTFAARLEEQRKY